MVANQILPYLLVLTSLSVTQLKEKVSNFVVTNGALIL